MLSSQILQAGRSTLALMLALLWLTLVPSRALAQFDPSSALLLNNGTGNGTGVNSAVDSGRYTIRPKAEVQKPEPKAPAAKKTREPDDSAEPVTVVVPAVQNSNAASQQVGSGQPVIIRCDTHADPRLEARAECPSTPAPASPRDSGRRLNLMDLSFAPGYLYNNSDSSYSYRSYTVAAPILTVDANVWLMQSFSLHGSYTGSLSGSVNDSSSGARNVPATEEWFTAGVRMRKFVSADALSPVMNFGVEYYDYEFHVPADANLREKLVSTGLRLSLDVEIPVNANRSWTLGAMLAPKLSHTESATGITFQSGGNVDANAVGISLGGRLQFDRNDAIFWKASQIVEKDLFAGQASLADQNGVTPTGVSVTNSFTILEVGYSWGD